MNSSVSSKAKQAFTLVELLVVVVIFVIMVPILFPPYPHAKVKAMLVVCLTNLRQVSVGYNMWAGTKGDLFPWQVSTNAGGTMELIPSGNAADHFLPLSTVIPQPDIFACLADRPFRQRTNNYTGFSNTNLSYFVSSDSRPSTTTANPSSLILAGDRHLSLGNQSVSAGLFVTTNYASLGWKQGHSPRGVLAFVDGHAEAIKKENLPAVFQRQTLATTRLVIP